MKYSELDLSKLLKILMYQKYSSEYENVNANLVYYELINRYYQKTGILLELNEDNKKLLYCWLRDEVGYKFLNELIKETIDKLTGNYKNKHAYFVLDNFSALSNIITLQISDSLLDMNKNMAPVSSTSKKETEDMVVEFLKEIDPSLEWLHIYKEAKDKKRIIYLDELSEEEIEEFSKKIQLNDLKKIANGCTYINGEQYIWVTRKNTTEDFISIVHEFIHYVVDYKNDVKELPHILLEFPAIFYELYSHKFLLQKGFSVEEINLLKVMRMNNSLYGASGISDVFEIINLYLLNGCVDKEMLIEKSKCSLQNTKHIVSNGTMDVLVKNNDGLLDPNTFALNEYENCVKKMISLIKDIYQCYPYIVGTYFSNRALEKKDDYTLLKMKYITENCSGLNVCDALEMINVNVDKLGIIPVSIGNELK